MWTGRLWWMSMLILASKRSFSCCSQPDDPPLHERLTAEERIVLFGHHSLVPSYQVISTLKTDASHARSKRSIDSKQPIKVEFEAFGDLFRLKLWPNLGLLSPGFHLINQNSQTSNTGGQSDWSTRQKLVGCFFQGYDEAHADSAAAISLCNGIQGVIESKPTVYVINPVPKITSERLFTGNNSNYSNNSTPQQYHLILKRNDFHHYQCPHGSGLAKQIRPNNNKQKIIHKRSIDIVASNKNFLDADKTTTTTDSSMIDIDPTVPSTTAKSLPSTKPDSGNQIQTQGINSSSNHEANHLLPTFNITVETAVFVDESLYHVLSKTFPIDTEQQIVLYVLTIMNAVQLLFKQPSIGRPVDVSVVLMDLLRQQPKNLTPSDNIDTYLTNFCVWQHKKRLRETGGPTPDWDHALLLSGINMYVVDGYGRRKRHVVGLAPVSGMCNSLNSCTISEGTNFQTVLVAGHEMGHSLGMEHDGSQDGNWCNKDDFVMSPTLGPGKTTWSECSKHYLDKFVLTPQATCVLGRSSHVNIIHQFIPPHRLPGERFNVDEQCRFRFGPAARHHSSQSKSEICRVIKCFVKSSNSKNGFYSGRGLYQFPVKSTYNTHPALEGSECGLNKWCREGRCVSKPAIHSSGRDRETGNYMDAFNEIDNNFISNTTTSTIYPKTNNVNEQLASTRISNRHKKRPTAKPGPPSSSTATMSTMAPTTSASTTTTTASTVLIVDNIYTSSPLENKSNDSIYGIDSNYVSEAQNNPYSKPANRILAGQHWSSSRLNQLNPVHGNWSEWSEYGPCLSECVAPGIGSMVSELEDVSDMNRAETMLPLGVQTSLRHCDSPSPMNGGGDCLGPDTRVKLCNAIKTCSADSATSAASGIGAKHRSKLDVPVSGRRYQIRTVDEYISDTCFAASKLNDKIQNHGTQYPSYDSASHSCYVWCFKKSGGFMTQGWRLPDGTPCGRKMAVGATSATSAASLAGGQSKDLIQISGYCYNGQCRAFNCRGEIFGRQSISSQSSSTNVYNGVSHAVSQNQTSEWLLGQEQELLQRNCPSTYDLGHIINQLEEQVDDTEPNSYDSTYRLIEKVKTPTIPVVMDNLQQSGRADWANTIGLNANRSMEVSKINLYHLDSNWSDWQPVTECQYSIACIQNGRGFRLVTRECRRPTCLGRREALQVCPDIAQTTSVGSGPTAMYDLYEQYCPTSIRRTADEYAKAICQKYQVKFSSLLSGNGRQLMGAKNYGCIVACEDRLWKDIHYQMDAFNDGKFPFGTDCSTNDRRGYCLNGKCIHFDQYQISYDTTESVLYRNEILQLFAPSATELSVEPTLYGSFSSSLSAYNTIPEKSLYSAIFNNEIYKRATSNLQKIEQQPAYQSFISSRRFKRDLGQSFTETKIPKLVPSSSNNRMFRKATVQEHADPEEDYVSWSMLRNRPSPEHHHRQYRRPITRTMKKSPTMAKIDLKPLLLKPLRPIKLTSVSRQSKFAEKSRMNRAGSSDYFQTFTLVKASRRRNAWTEPSLTKQQIGIALAKNANATFLDDDDDDDDDDEDDEENVDQAEKDQNEKITDEEDEGEEEEEEEGEEERNENKGDEPMERDFTQNNQTVGHSSLSSRKKQLTKFGLGHESWPPTTTKISLSLDTDRSNQDRGRDRDQDEDDNSDDKEELEDQLRVEPYVWSVILSECNRACGQGIRTVKVVCTVGQKSVSEHFCDQHSKPMHKPMESCKQRDCIGRWRVEPWSQCFAMSGRCKQSGLTANQSSVWSFQSRTIACVGPMMAFEPYSHQQTNGPNIRSTQSESAQFANGLPQKHSKAVTDSTRVFSLLSHDYCDAMTKPIQWKACQTNGASQASLPVKCD